MQPAGDHAPGVGLHGDHSPEAMTESPAHQVGAAAGLEPDDAPAGQAVYCWCSFRERCRACSREKPNRICKDGRLLRTTALIPDQPCPVEVTAPGSTLQPACPEGTAVSSQTKVSQGVALASPVMRSPQETPILRPGVGLLPVHLPSPKASSFTGVHGTHAFLAPSEVFIITQVFITHQNIPEEKHKHC